MGGAADVDAVVAIFVSPRAGEAEAYAAAIAAGAGAVPATKPVLAVFLCGGQTPAALHTGPRGRLPAYEFPESAAHALAATARYAAWRRRPTGTVARVAHGGRGSDPRRRRARPAPAPLAAGDVAAILRAAGIPQAMAEQVALDDAVAAAERLGYPLVMKAVAPGSRQPRAAAAVLLGLRTAADVARGLEDLRARIARLEAVVLQREIEPVLEARVSVCADPTFGPLVRCGLGGAIGALTRDVAYRLPPVSDVDAESLLASLRLAPLLDGHAGEPPADRAALIDVIRRVSALVEIVPDIECLDLDLALLRPGAGAMAIDARMTLR